MAEDDGLPVAAMHRIVRKAGADRVSESAAIELGRILEELGLQIGREALDWSMHAGRRTVREDDVEMAAKKVLTR